MKSDKFGKIFIGICTVHVCLVALFVVIGSGGGCKSPEVLANRTYIPAPVSGPPAPVSPVTESVERSTNLPIPTPPVKVEKTVEEIPPLPKIETKTLTYTVKKGDSLWKIARKYGVSISELAAYNNISKKDILQVGTVLNIPPGGELLSDKDLAYLNKKTLKHRRKTLKIKSKKKYKTKTSAVFTGSKNGAVYVVKKGDSLWKIAIAHHLKVSAIAEANNLDIKKPLYVGQKLILPGVGEASVETSSRTEPENENILSEESSENKNETTEETSLVNENEDNNAATESVENSGESETTTKQNKKVDDVELLKKTTGETDDDIVNDIIGDNDSEEIEKEATEILNADDEKAENGTDNKDKNKKEKSDNKQ